MATVKVQTKPVAPVIPEIESVTLILNAEEAELVMTLIGTMAPHPEVCFNLYTKLSAAGLKVNYDLLEKTIGAGARGRGKGQPVPEVSEKLPETIVGQTFGGFKVGDRVEYVKGGEFNCLAGEHRVIKAIINNGNAAQLTDPDMGTDKIVATILSPSSIKRANAR